MLAAAATLAAALAAQGNATLANPEAGISEALARDRASRISQLRYDLSLSIPSDRQVPVTGRVTITFALSDASKPLAIDFDPHRANAVHSVEVNGDGGGQESASNGRTPVPPLVNGHLVILPPRLTRGENRITIAFDAGDAPLNRSDEFLYTIFVPARAHEAIPCFDQPDLKARWTLSLEVPNGWEAIGNGEVIRKAQNGGTRVGFAPTQPISTYLFAFAAGRFSVERAERRGPSTSLGAGPSTALRTSREMRMFHRENDAAKVARNRDAIFDLHAAALDWMEQYTGIPYPFGKFDVVLLPAFQFGGMEHPGAIFYNANNLLLEESATQTQILDRASTISHETAHMWFGDLVTMRWFTDVWMKEVFANFMAAKIVNPSFPAVNHDLRFLLDNYPSAYSVDRTAGSNAIRQPLANLNEAGTLYGAIIYQKAPIVMRQLETIVGADAFRDGLREYLRQFSYGNASWSDLIELLDRRTPEDLASWSRAWVEEAGRVILTTNLTLDNGRIARLSITQRDPDPKRGLIWRQRIQVALGGDDTPRLIPIDVAGATTDVEEARGLRAPGFVLPNGGGIAYGELHLDEGSRRWLLSNLPSIGDALTRGSAWIALWDAMLDGEVRAADLIDLALRALPRETDELLAQRILGYLNQAYWRFSPCPSTPLRAGGGLAACAELTPRVERVLQDGLAAAPTQSLKGAYFATLRDVALTKPVLTWLEAVWRQEQQVPGLRLAENDFITLAQELAVRAVPGWHAIVDRQIERTQNADRRERLQFVAPALSDDPAVRERFFESLKQLANRRHEPWVLDGLTYLHHPLRAAASEKYIRPSLELLREIQQTGDIFFPKRWMDSTLSGHRSRSAASTVRAFVDRLPRAYPDRLRRVILSSADNLFRASR